MSNRSGDPEASFVRGAARSVLILAAVLVSLASRCGSDLPAPTPAGLRAMEWTKELVAIGPRPPGSAGIERAREWIAGKVRQAGFTIQTDRFDARTPLGTIGMVNLSYVIPGRSSSEKFLLIAHYDSKRFDGFEFTGANDAASSVALLLALSNEIARMALPFDTEVVFVDGEEALVSWSSTDGLYGSRRLAGTLKLGRPVRMAVVVDMIGDADLRLVRDRTVPAESMAKLTAVLENRGWAGLLEPTPVTIEDDHTPLLEAGIPTLHLMDFTYGGKGSPGTYWHTPEDTVDKLSVVSLSVVGEIVLDLLGK